MADTRTRLPKATRFFARLASFDLECPACGHVFQVRMRPNAHPDARGRGVFDWTTARFRCSACTRVYILGMLAWPIGPSKGVATTTPRDQVSNARQLSALRKEGQGWWLPDEAKITRDTPDETNLTTEEDRREARKRYEEDVDEDY